MDLTKNQWLGLLVCAVALFFLFWVIRSWIRGYREVLIAKQQLAVRVNQVSTQPHTLEALLKSMHTEREEFETSVTLMLSEILLRLDVNKENIELILKGMLLDKEKGDPNQKKDRRVSDSHPVEPEVPSHAANQTDILGAQHSTG